jgi:hypothetical protein
MADATAETPDIRRWLPATYLVALCFVLAPFIQTVGSLWPMRLSEATWRYGAVGIFLSSVGAASIGLLIALAAAVFLGHRVMLRAIGILAIALTLFVLMVCGAFALDVVQVRSIVRTQVRGGFDLAAAKAIFTGLITMATSILVSVAAFRAAAPASSRRRGRARPELVVARMEDETAEG